MHRVCGVFAGLVLFLSACSPSPAPLPTSTPSLNSLIPSSTPTPERELCSPEPIKETGHNDFSGVVDGASAELVWPANFVPWWVRSTPDGRVLAVTGSGNSVYELKPDGSLTIVLSCRGLALQSFAATNDGALWLGNSDGRVFRVGLDGKTKLISSTGYNQLEAAPDNSVYALGESGLVHFLPDGTETLIADQVGGRKFAISPEGQVVVKYEGTVYLVSETGELTVLASGYGPEEWVTFSPDGLLYVTHWTGVDVINLETGSISQIAWLQNSNVGESGAFTPDGKLLLFHPNTNVFLVDLETQELSIFHQTISNSSAMAAKEGGSVYIAFGNQTNQTSVYRIVDAETLELVGSVPFGGERSMEFDSAGVGYLAVRDYRAGNAIFRFDPESGEFESWRVTECSVFSMDIDPLTDQLWWEECGKLRTIDDTGTLQSLPSIPNSQNVSFAINYSGTFYSIAFFNRTDGSQPWEHRLYEWDGTTWVEIADLTQSDAGVSIATLAACPDGFVYTVESLGPENLPPERAGGSSYNAVRRLETDGTLTLLGYDFAFDGNTADCDSASNTLFFTSGIGVFAFIPPSK